MKPPSERPPASLSAQYYLGIHLAGPNSDKTSLVAIKTNAQGGYSISEVYEKIGSFDNIFSDDRLVQLVRYYDPGASIFVDAPLTSPPCVACTREQCPSPIKCEDVSVAFMLSLINGTKLEKKSRKKRPINPQSHRLWDVIEMLETDGIPTEPTYSGNKAPLLIRAQTLQKRLKAYTGNYLLKETSVLKSLMIFAIKFDLDKNLISLYRDFEKGRMIRAMILEKFVTEKMIEIPQSQRQVLEVSLSCFQAFICSIIALFHSLGKTINQPESFIVGESWVHTPDLSGNQ